MKISIVTISYNSELHIRQTIQSVLSQSHQDIEYIIIDGLSTDTTMDIVSEYKNLIDSVITEKDSGMYDAYNKGSKLATGDYILYLNSDDYLYNDNVIETICKQIEECDSNPKLVAAQSNVVIDGTIIPDWEIPASREWCHKLDPMLPSLLVHKDIYKNILFDGSCALGGDSDFYLRLRDLGIFDISFKKTLMTCFRMGGVSTNTHKIRYYALEKEMFNYKLTGKIRISRLLLNYFLGYIKIITIRLLGDRNYYTKVLFPLYLLRRKTF